MDYFGKGEVLTNIDLTKFVNKIWEKYTYCSKKVLDFLFQLVKNGSENKSVEFIFCSVYDIHTL